VTDADEAARKTQEPDGEVLLPPAIVPGLGCAVVCATRRAPSSASSLPNKTAEHAPGVVANPAEEVPVGAGKDHREAATAALVTDAEPPVGVKWDTGLAVATASGGSNPGSNRNGVT
jgi:hypothetical protein